LIALALLLSNLKRLAAGDRPPSRMQFVSQETLNATT
jgi:hypothetical protein